MSTAPQANESAKKPESKAKIAAKANAAAEKSLAESKAAKPAVSKTPAAPRVKKAKVAKPAPRPAHSEGRLAQVLIAPIVSEKATMTAEKHNQVLFKVMRDATKPEIKAAVELMFKVTVDSVQTVQHKGKTKRFGKSTGRRDHIKKAYVCLAAGEELNFSGEGA
jgi:large subunit ribosomal protein L23